ncbi:MAG: sterol desaturase family protein [Planctomycetota bacterium]
MNETLIDRILGTDVDYVTAAVPLFFALAAIEFLCAWVARFPTFRLNDSISDLGCGIIDQTLKVFVHGVVLLAYIYIYEHFRIFEVQQFSPAGKWVAAFLLFLGVDFCFYWHHRFGHEWAVPWATHVVHHQSEEFNLIVALRQSAFEHYLLAFFYFPLALIGFPPAWYVSMWGFNLIWQFWCHTRLVGKLGPMEWIFNTPSHHRVHHGRNPKYLDKNYAGTLIIWDRLFGTFIEEQEEPVYGITKPLRSMNPVWANFHMWVELAEDARKAPYWWDKIKIWFMPLGWLPRGLPEKPRATEVSRDSVVKYDPQVPTGLSLYILVQFLSVLGVGLFITENEQGTPLVQLALPAAYIIFSMLPISGLFERKPWVLPLEIARLQLFAFGLVWHFLGTPWVAWVTVGAVLYDLVSLFWLWWYRRAILDETQAASAAPSLSEPILAAGRHS